MGWVPLPRSFPISWYCKLDTGMQEPNLHPELQMQQTVASGLAAQTCQFDRPCTNLAWCSFPGEPLCQRIHLISPHKNLQDSSQRYLLDQDPATNQTEGNFTPINQISVCLCVCLSTCLAVCCLYNDDVHTTHDTRTFEI